jgi:murein DD-endopeptidase MepM/ murein hydrolase activator NlpD
MKFLFRPVDNTYIHQFFGEDKACQLKTTKKNYIACDGKNPPAGYESVYKALGMTGHTGLDYHAPMYTPIYSSQDGIVQEIQAERERGLGLGIITERKHYCDETGKDEYFKIRYWHNHSHYVKLGDKVKIGQLIALADNTGISAGSHLHFEIKPVKVTFKKDGTISKVVNIFQTNGYYGSVNPLPYMLDQKASDFGKYTTWQERLAFTVLKWLK